MVQFGVYLIIVARCNLLRFRVNFDKILLNKNIQKLIIFIYNNDIAAARVELWSTSKLRSALHFSYSIVIRRFYSRANTAQF